MGDWSDKLDYEQREYYGHFYDPDREEENEEAMGKESNLEKAKEIVKKYYRYARCGLFDSRNLVGDCMETIYEGEGLTIDICYRYSYFEVFGLSNADFKKLESYYNSLSRK